MTYIKWLKVNFFRQRKIYCPITAQRLKNAERESSYSG